MSKPEQFLQNRSRGAVIVTDTPEPGNPYPQAAKVRFVKNLGWLLRNWGDVQDLTVYECPFPGWDCILRANLRGGGYYATTWADRGVLWDWLKRPVFYTVKLDWFGVPLVVDKRPTKAPPTSSIKSKRTV